MGVNLLSPMFKHFKPHFWIQRRSASSNLNLFRTYFNGVAVDLFELRLLHSLTIVRLINLINRPTVCTFERST